MMTEPAERDVDDLNAADAQRIAPPRPGGRRDGVEPGGVVLALIVVRFRPGDQLIFAVTDMVGAAGLNHSIVGPAEAFTLLWANRIDATTALAGSIAPAVLSNLTGRGPVRSAGTDKSARK